jgi:hypothetical protein
VAFCVTQQDTYIALLTALRHIYSTFQAKPPFPNLPKTFHRALPPIPSHARFAFLP